ncbi:DNA internalization-related competence protein ComEC/Rec2 [Alteribacter lacisalsi]|uniref:DNA internalization-related competence protein ComEC/Rec2 n=1 Tax=Alteribacter lacisalsi TaxID=2045244 RepID=A0A2W0HY38_9BACI|nr:DNA internalization-related competence protein ComEC/Rec2 [Alteribacter lacisalsi]PYZ98708.1 DNA internalization-related competence protein ComEC/Rec2 [Alteribacter lacisalsi]
MIRPWFLCAFITLAAVMWAFEGGAFFTYVFTAIAFLLTFIHRKKLSFYWIGFMLFWFIMVMFWTGLSASGNTTVYTGDVTQIRGTVISVPLERPSGVRFVFKTEEGEKIQAAVPVMMDAPEYGDKCLLKGKLERPSPKWNEFGFDYRFFLQQQGIEWLFYAGEYVCVSENNLMGVLYRLRNKGLSGIEALAENQNEKRAAAVIQALVFGERTLMEENQREAYQIIGVSHLLAVSGLHVGLVIFLVLFLLQRAGVTKESSLTGILFFLPFYIVMAGGAPSVTRASLMSFAIIAALKMNMPVKPADTIAFVFILLLLWDPWLLYHLGFQLSFLTTLVLILSGRILSRPSGSIVTLLRVTFLAQLASFPLIVFHFHEFSLLSIPFNLIFIPYISFIILPLSLLITFSLMLFPLLSKMLFIFAAVTLEWFHEVMFWVNDLSLFRIVFGQASPVMVFVMYISVIAFFTAWDRLPFRRCAPLLSAVLLTALIQLALPYLNKEGTVTMLDVGQGDAILIELPFREKVYLIDTGGFVPFSDGPVPAGPGERVILPHLKGRGITEIDKLILTHGHADHIGEVCVLAEKIKIGMALYPIGGMDSPLEREVYDCLADAAVPIVNVSEGAVWNTNGAQFRVLSPNGTENTENDRSIVLQGLMGGRSWLFTGDIEEAAERRILHDYPDLDADVLKTSHHGSSSSTIPEFAELIRPGISLIPVGRNNRHGHPSAEVVSRLAANGARVYRTDEKGDVSIRFTREEGITEVKVMVEPETQERQ